jgi:hypothetical protein
MDQLGLPPYRGGSILKCVDGDLIVSKRRMRKAGALQMVRQRRDAEPRIRARLFVVCGLPIRKPGKGILLHQRRNSRGIKRAVR